MSSKTTPIEIKNLTNPPREGPILRIGLYIVGHDGWIAGRVHVACFVNAIKKVYKQRVLVYLLTKTITPDIRQYADETGCDQLIKFKAPKVKRHKNKLVNWWVTRNQAPQDWDNALRKHKIDAVFGRTLLDSGGTIPTLSWFPDFQHRHCPEMFDAKEFEVRDKKFIDSALSSSRVMLMSKTAKSDFDNILPEFAHKGRVLKTTSQIPSSIFLVKPNQVINKYELPHDFIFVPNQFWKHKNHLIIFKALKLLKDRNIKINIVCSGHKSDYRHPDYYESLMAQVEEMGLLNQVFVLGLIPKVDVFQLMRHSLCILNASLFEGYGLAADEARNIGKRSLLSDIAAHREHESHLTTFFDPSNVKELALKMESMTLLTAGPDEELENVARKQYKERLKSCADSFIAVVKEFV